MASLNLYPLASLEQIQQSPSKQDGMPDELEEDLRAFGCQLIHQAGILLKQKQVALATAQILFQRFWFVSSMKQYGIGDMGMGALYLASKLEECPIRMRDLINVYDLLLAKTAHEYHSTSSGTSPTKGKFVYTPMSYFGNTFYDLKDALVIAEMQLLKRLGFHMNVVLPYGTLVNYLQILGMARNSEACTAAWGYLNDALQTPVYALYAIPTIVCAAIFLTSRKLEIPLPEKPVPWWELFDADWTDMWSVAGRIMRLYRPRTPEKRVRVKSLLTKKDVRSWLEEHGEKMSDEH